MSKGASDCDTYEVPPIEDLIRMACLFSKAGAFLKKRLENLECEAYFTDSDEELDEVDVVETSSEPFNPGKDMAKKIVLKTLLNGKIAIELTPYKMWSALQHYLFFMYQHVISKKPENICDFIPAHIGRAIMEILATLGALDMPQLYLKLVLLGRDFVMVAKCHLDDLEHLDLHSYITYLMAYYNAVCAAALKASPFLKEFNMFVTKRYNINWVGMNKAAFYHHIYTSKPVQTKFKELDKLKGSKDPHIKSLLVAFESFTNDIATVVPKSISMLAVIRSTSVNCAQVNPKVQLLKDWNMFSEHKKILKAHGWQYRSPQSIHAQDIRYFDVQLHTWFVDTVNTPEPLIDEKGCCLCEDCLSAEFKNNTMASAVEQTYRAETPSESLILCYLCQKPLELRLLIHHIHESHAAGKRDPVHGIRETVRENVIHSPRQSAHKEMLKAHSNSLYEGLLEKNAQLQRSLLELIEGTDPDRHKILREKKKKEKEALEKEGKDKKHRKHGGPKSKEPLYPYKPVSTAVSSDSDENPFKNTKEVILQLANDSPLLQSGNESLLMEAANSEDCKMFFEQMKKLVEESELENGRTKKKQKPGPSGIKTETPDTNKCGTKSSGTQTSKKMTLIPNISEEDLIASALENEEFRKPHMRGVGNNIDTKILEFLKTANATVQKAVAANPPRPPEICEGHACGHKCKPEEEKRACDKCDHKESRKCDCAYCEVFGAAFPLTAKQSEIRDRLRSRLNQRKEKEVEQPECGAWKGSEYCAQCTVIKYSGASSPMHSKTDQCGSGSKNNVGLRFVKCDTTEPPDVHHPVPTVGSSIKSVLAALEGIDKSSMTNVSQSPESDCITEHDHTLGCIPTVDPDLIDSVIQEAMTDHCSIHRSPSSLSTCSIFTEPGDCRDINELLNYIEGNKTVDKVAVAHKKAAKKARQRSKKAQQKEERVLIELEKQKQKAIAEAKLKEAQLKEEKRKEAEANAIKLAEQQKKAAKKETKVTPKPEVKKTIKKKTTNSKPEDVVKVLTTAKVGNDKLVEENIPAMVTIKRAPEGGSEATVTITLKGSTPDTDKLLFTFVNGNESEVKKEIGVKEDTGIANKRKGIESNKPATAKVATTNIKTPKKKKEKEHTTKLEKVALATVTKKEIPPVKKPVMETFASHQLQQAFNNNRDIEVTNVTTVKPPQSIPKEEIPLPMLNLPTSITITKVEGPPNSASSKYSNSNNSYYGTQTQNTNPPPTKSGVIVVDTEKLIQQAIAASISKRNRKMSKKKQDSTTQPLRPQPPPKKVPERKKPTQPKTVTFKNPVFDVRQNNKSPIKPPSVTPTNQQASILKGDNGMVTIRSPRLQNPFETDSNVCSYFSDVQPIFNNSIVSPYGPIQQPSKAAYESNSYYNNNYTPFTQYTSHYHARDFLAGLPGIEITKISKAAADPHENKQTVQQPIIPNIANVAANNICNEINNFNFEADEWCYDNLFKPRSNYDEDLDEEELEQFKRFCHQPFSDTRNDTSNLGPGTMGFNINDVSYA